MINAVRKSKCIKMGNEVADLSFLHMSLLLIFVLSQWKYSF